MIHKFEDITKQLSAEEIKYAERLAKSWNLDPFKHEHKNAESLIATFEAAGIKILESRLRKIINYIRLKDLCSGLCSDNKGYYIASTPADLKDTLISLRDRILNQTATYKALLQQYNSMVEKSK